MNIAPKIINKIYKCSGKQHLYFRSISMQWWTSKLLFKLKLLKVADLIPILEKFITWVLFAQKLQIIAQNVHQAMIYKLMSFMKF